MHRTASGLGGIGRVRGQDQKKKKVRSLGRTSCEELDTTRLTIRHCACKGALRATNGRTVLHNTGRKSCAKLRGAGPRRKCVVHLTSKPDRSTGEKVAHSTHHHFDNTLVHARKRRCVRIEIIRVVWLCVSRGREKGQDYLDDSGRSRDVLSFLSRDLNETR